MEEEIAEPAGPSREAPLKLTGYVDATYFYNFGPGQAKNPLAFPADTEPKGDFNLSGLWLRLEKPLVKDSHEAHGGFQLGVMLGEDATYYAANPTETPAGSNSSSPPCMWPRRLPRSGCRRPKWSCGAGNFRR